VRCCLTAIDVTVNILQSLEVIVSLGCDRVLTSGGEATALEGTATIRKMIEQTTGRLTVVPGRPLTGLLYLSQELQSETLVFDQSLI